MGLRDLLRAVDTVLDQFHQPTYYENPSFHFSIGWDEFENVSEDLARRLGELELPKEGITVTSITIKIGNKVYNIDLF